MSRTGPAIPGRSRTYEPHAQDLILPQANKKGAAHKVPVDLSDRLKLAARLTATDAMRLEASDPHEILLYLGLDDESLGPKLSGLANREEALREQRKKAGDLSPTNNKTFH